MSYELRATIERYIDEVLNRGNLELLSEICSPRYKRYVSPTSEPLNLEEQRQRLAAIRLAFPDWKLSTEQIICDGNIAAFRATIKGTHAGSILNLAATGKVITVSALDMVRFQDGKFIEHWGGPDLFNLVQQLGARVTLAE